MLKNMFVLSQREGVDLTVHETVIYNNILGQLDHTNIIMYYTLLPIEYSTYIYIYVYISN